jgi:hypothetical protein
MTLLPMGRSSAARSGGIYRGYHLISAPPPVGGIAVIETLQILDTATSSWVSRESAEGGPLIAGLPYTGNPVVVWVRFRD